MDYCGYVLFPREATKELMQPFHDVALDEGKGGYPDYEQAWSDLIEAAEKFVADEGFIDLEMVSWNAIKEAMAKSPWIPEEYCMNDIVADIIHFLTEPELDKQ